jgi:hypothetical protein
LDLAVAISIVAVHEFETAYPDRGVMAAMVPNLVEYGAFNEFVRGDDAVWHARDWELHIVPGEPAADLGIPNKEQNLTVRNAFKSENQTGVVGVVVELQRELAEGVEPILVNFSPCLRGVVVGAFDKLPNSGKGSILTSNPILRGKRKAAFPTARAFS